MEDRKRRGVPQGRGRRRRWLYIAGLLLVLAGAGAWLGDRLLKERDHPGLRVFVRQWMRNYPASFAVEPVRLSITVDDHDMQELQRVVDEARERGVILPEGNSYVPATIGSDGESFKAKLRIKGKLTDHVQGSKWSFRVVARKDGGFMGMKRFSLQHPGTRNYLCDWLYHRLMAAEGVAALRYGFIRVEFNGEDLGIYAFEEHFGPELLQRNGRAEGPIFRFDPALFWEHRLNQMNGLSYDEPFAAYQAGAVDAFGSSDIAKDKQARERFEEAVGLMDAFRRGRLTASQVFDVDRLARHHAVLDLVGGHHSMDWSDVKFYYDPILRRVEPIAYESFSAHPIRTLAGSNKWVGATESSMDLHTQWFNDEGLFRAYVRHLERVSRTSWLDSAFAALKPALDSASATLYREFPYKELDRQVYYRNQRIIRKLLDPPKPFHAYLDDSGPDTVRITVVPIEGLPMEVHALLLPDGKAIPPVQAAVVPVRKPGKVGAPMVIRFPNPGKVEREGLRITCSVLGSSVQRHVDVFAHGLMPAEEAVRLALDPIDVRSLPWLEIDEESRSILIRPGAAVVSRDVEIPPGYTLHARAPLTLTIQKGVRFTSRSPVRWEGDAEARIELVNDGAVQLVGAAGRSLLREVDIQGAGQLVVQETMVKLDACALRSTTEGPVLTAVRSRLELEAVEIEGGRDGLMAVASEVKASGSAVLAPADDGVVLRGGRLEWSGGALEGGQGAALKMGVHAIAAFEGAALRGGANGAEVREGAQLSLKGGEVKAKAIVLLVKDRQRIAGPSRVRIEAVRIDAGQRMDPGSGNEVAVDGAVLPQAGEQQPTEPAGAEQE
ncbi:MAG: CotH kinase family protein [Flavobacteriales bacterium]|nr:MAG: CotH kinase family protein [Flavobacteriales bacterium]